MAQTEIKSEYTIHFYIAPFKFLMTQPKSSYRAQQTVSVRYNLLETL